MAIDTIPRKFFHTAVTVDRKDAFRYKRRGRYVDVSHREMLEKVHLAALGLRALGLARQDRVALISENRVEWVVADLAILSAGCINVPVYTSLPANQIEHILVDSEARAVMVSNEEQLEKVLSCRANLPMLQHLVSFDPECDAEGVVTLDALYQRGSMVGDKPGYEELIDSIGPSDWASIIYTSGTTGEPKGAVLTHENFLHNVDCALRVLEVTPDDSCLSFLPLSHVFERTDGYYLMMTVGASIAYVESMDTVAENLAEVRPTLMIAVPRFYEKMYARVMATIEQGSPLKKKLFYWAIRAGHRYVAEKLDGRISFATKSRRSLAAALVFRKLKKRTGGRIRFFVSGGAPLSPEINRFFNAAGLTVLEGYGLTENSPTVSANTLENFRFGTIGKPLPGIEVRIAEDGEILTRSRSVMQGYYKKPAETAEVIVDGWLHTGDVGFLDDDGYITITDRKKDIIVTAGGKNVAPQLIENRMKQSRYVEEAIVVGNRRKFISAILAPSFENLRQYAIENDIPHAADDDLIGHPGVRSLFDEEVKRLCESFATFEQIKKYVLLDRPLAIETGELTPSLKVKRRIIEQKYGDLIESLYKD